MSLNYRGVIIYTNDFEKIVKAVDSIKIMWPNLTIIDNSINKCIRSKYPKVDIYETPTHFSCSQSFNCAQDIARKYNVDILIMMHGDMEVTDEKELKKFLKYLENLQKDKSKNWGVCLTHYDALAAFNMDCMDVIGPWDTNITQYPIDVDYYYRIKKYGFEFLDYGGQWIDHHASATIRKDVMMDHINLIHTNDSNNAYYQKKWGGCKDQEQYIFPFNGADINKQYLKIISDPIYGKLLELFSSGEGSFLTNHTELSRLSQYTLMLNILNATKPKKILEVGTQRYFFALFLSSFIENFTIDTFDLDNRCLDLYDTINNHLKNSVNIVFHCGDSKETLLENKIGGCDFGWIDGAHDYVTSFSDILNVGVRNIPYILVDDSRLENVDRAITDFLYKDTDYYKIYNPYWEWDNRGITILRRKRSG